MKVRAVIGSLLLAIAAPVLKSNYHHGVSDVYYLACSTTRAPRITFSYLTAGPRVFQHLVFMSQSRLATSGACYSDRLDGSFHIRPVSQHTSATDGYHDWNMLFGVAFVED